MTHTDAIQKFWRLASSGKSAALDINTQTGELLVQASRNLDTGAEGNGAPGVPYTGSWRRIILSTCGALSSDT